MQEQKPPSSQPSKTATSSKRPMITPPPRPFSEALFNGGAGLMGFSPGPMTLVSNFFSDTTDDSKSFSQLLAGAMASPAAQKLTEEQGEGGGVNSGLGFKQNKPASLVIAQQPSLFVMPQGLLSPASLLESPGFSVFSPGPQVLLAS